MSIPHPKNIQDNRRYITISTNHKPEVNQAFPVYSQKLAGYLMLQGFRLMGVEENDRHKGKNVFYFMESEQIRRHIKTYLSSIAKQ